MNNYLEKITELYAFVSVDEGGEGVISKMMSMPPIGNTMMPFVCADKARVDSLMPLAKKIAKETNCQIRLIKFVQREVLIEDLR